jgi:hypothetical protein
MYEKGNSEEKGKESRRKMGATRPLKSGSLLVGSARDENGCDGGGCIM